MARAHMGIGLNTQNCAQHSPQRPVAIHTSGRMPLTINMSVPEAHSLIVGLVAALAESDQPAAQAAVIEASQVAYGNT